MSVSVLLAIGCALAASVCIYLASPHQRGLARPWPAGPSRTLAAVLLAGSFGAFLEIMQPVAASFTFVTLLMLLFIALPYIGALIFMRQGR